MTDSEKDSLRYKCVVQHELHLAQMRSGRILYCVLAVFLKLTLQSNTR